MVEAAQACEPGFPADAIQVIPTTDRAAVPALLSLTDDVDLCMPRGGEGLIRAVAECSKVPVIKHYKGVCHVYVDKDADLEMAVQIAEAMKAGSDGEIIVTVEESQGSVQNVMETRARGGD